MCRAEFNTSVRPHVREFPIGKQGIGFDRHELDAWADSYVERHSVEKTPKADDNAGAANVPSSPIKEKRQWPEVRGITGLKQVKGIWHIDKIVDGRRLQKSTGTSDIEEAERFLSPCS